jgi:hypothetical protein
MLDICQHLLSLHPLTHVNVFFSKFLLTKFRSIALQILDYGLAHVLSDDYHGHFVSARYVNNPVFILKV